jgi:CHAD domain-containing protein
MALEQLDQAIELLEDEGEAVSAAHAVHETRKSLKRLRALVGLLEDGTGKRAFAEESATLRRAGERLARARDAEVMVSTLDGLLKRNAGGLARRGGVVKLRGRLVAERDRVVARALGDTGARLEVLDDLRSVRLRVMGWTLSDRAGVELVEPGLRRLYRQGRRDYRRAMGKGERTRTMHQWRKRVKDLRYVAEMLARAPADPAQGKGSSDIRRLARRADELGELLGEEHDLAVLAERLRAPARRGNGQGLEVGGGTRKTLLKLIAQRRRRLRRKALRRGERLYRPRPKRFARRIRELSRRLGP